MAATLACRGTSSTSRVSDSPTVLTAMVRPSPSALVTRLAVVAPARLPTAEPAMTMPSSIGCRCTTRTAYTTKTVMYAPKNRLSAAPWVSTALSSLLPHTARSPSAIDCRTEARTSGTSGAGSGLRIAIRPAAENRYDTESAVSVIGAVTRPTSTPASPGPATPANAVLAWILLLASVRCSWPTRLGTYDIAPTSNVMDSSPVIVTTTYSRPMDSSPVTDASGTMPIRTALPSAQAISTGRRRRRSSQTPANSDSNTTGTKRSAFSTPTSATVAFS